MPTAAPATAPPGLAARRSVGAGVGLLAVVSLFFGLRPVTEASAPAPTHEPRVAAWSARRLPHALSDTVGDVKLPVRVEEAVGAHSSCVVMRRASEAVLVRSPETPLIPASTQKLLVGAAALAVFGPDHRFQTEVVAAAGPDGSSVPRLWLVGGGDPVLMVEEYAAHLEARPATRGHAVTPLERLADEVVATGIRRVGRGIVGDATRHSDGHTIPTWKPSYIVDHDVSFISALTVNGGWLRWDPVIETATEPARYAAAELARLLEARGVEVEGEAASGAAPHQRTTVARVQSPPVSELVITMIRESDNLVAEVLTREIGLAANGEGTTAAGTVAIRDALGDLGIDVTGLSLTDGSGLDRNNRATCAVGIGVLDLMRSDERFRALDVGLAVAGRSGTLHRRFEGSPLEGKLRAKTGSLAGVVGLVGVLDVDPQRSFALLVNGDFGVAAGARMQDAIASVVGAFPFEGADPDLLGPPPARRVTPEHEPIESAPRT